MLRFCLLETVAILYTVNFVILQPGRNSEEKWRALLHFLLAYLSQVNETHLSLQRLGECSCN